MTLQLSNLYHLCITLQRLKGMVALHNIFTSPVSSINIKKPVLLTDAQLR